MAELSNEALTAKVIEACQDVRSTLRSALLYEGKGLIPEESQDEAMRLRLFVQNLDLEAVTKLLDKGLSSKTQEKLGIDTLFTPHHLAAARANHLILPRYVDLQNEALTDCLDEGPFRVTRLSEAEPYALAEPSGEDISPVDWPVEGVLRTAFVQWGRFSMRPEATGLHKPFYVHPLNSQDKGQIKIERVG